MMKFAGVEHFDDFGDEVYFWLTVSDVPQSIKGYAQQIDGDDYSDDCYGICVSYSRENDEYRIAPEERGTTIYYVDNDRETHWYMADIPNELMNEMIAGCKKVLAEGS